MPHVKLPRLLAPAVGDRLSVEVGGATVGEVIAGLLVECPQLEVHLFDESGRLRQHVLCFVDGAATRLDDPDAPVGSEIRFVQAVSGG